MQEQCTNVWIIKMIYQGRLYDVKAICYSVQLKNPNIFFPFFFSRYLCRIKDSKINKEIGLYLDYQLHFWLDSVLLNNPILSSKIMFTFLREFASKMALNNFLPSSSLSIYCISSGILCLFIFFISIIAFSFFCV